MALIPSESLNFPDSFRATEGWRVTHKPVPPTRVSRRTEPDSDNNGESKTERASVNRATPAQPAAPKEPLLRSEPPRDHPPEQPKPSEALRAGSEEAKEDVQAKQATLELEEQKGEIELEEEEEIEPAKPKLELQEPKEEPKDEEPRQVAQEQLVTKPADPPKTAPAPPVEKKSEQAQDVMPEPPPNITPSPGGATLSGADAAALLSKIFFSPAAATTELEEIKSRTHSPESPAAPAAAADPESSPPPTPVTSQPEPEPNKESKTEPAKPIQPRKEFSISAQPTSLFSDGLSNEQSSTVNIQTPAQTKQVLDLIAAAAARGVLKAEPVETTETIPAPATEKPAPEPLVPTSVKPSVESPSATQRVFNEIAPGPERSVLITPAAATPPVPKSQTATPPAQKPAEKPAEKPAAIEKSASPSASAAPTPAVTDAPSQPTAKTPAKIRIQPRKFKPRPIPPPAAQTEFTEMEAGSEVSIPDNVAYAAIGGDKASVAADVPKAELPPKPAYREWAERGMPLPPRDEPGGELFTPRDARNRWIRFGLGETGALAVFILLLSYLLNHKFPDPTLKLLIYILLFAVGALAIALPVMFIRNHPSQWQKRALNYRRDHDNYF